MKKLLSLVVLTIASFVKIGAAEMNNGTVNSVSLKALKNVVESKLNRYQNMPSVKLAREILWLIDVVDDIQESSLIGQEKDIYKQIKIKIKADYHEAKVTFHTNGFYTLEDTLEVKTAIYDQIYIVAPITAKVVINECQFLIPEHTAALIAKKRPTVFKVGFTVKPNPNRAIEKAVNDQKVKVEKSEQELNIQRGKLSQPSIDTNKYVANKPNKPEIASKTQWIVKPVLPNRQAPSRLMIATSLPEVSVQSRIEESNVTFPGSNEQLDQPEQLFHVDVVVPVSNEQLEVPQNSSSSNKWIHFGSGLSVGALLYAISRTEAVQKDQRLNLISKLASLGSLGYSVYSIIKK